MVGASVVGTLVVAGAVEAGDVGAAVVAVTTVGGVVAGAAVVGAVAGVVDGVGARVVEGVVGVGVTAPSFGMIVLRSTLGGMRRRSMA